MAEHPLRRQVDDAEVRDEGTDADDGDDRREPQDDTLHGDILAGAGRRARTVPRTGPEDRSGLVPVSPSSRPG